MTQTLHIPNESVQVWPFEVLVLSNQWLQTTWQTNGSAIIQGCDGKDVYSLFMHEQAAKTSKISQWPGQVFCGIYPKQSTYLGNLPWLAYCSGHYLSKISSSNVMRLPAPWCEAWCDLEAHVFEVKYKPINKGGGLPMEVEYNPNEDFIREITAGEFQVLATIKKPQRDNTIAFFARFKGVHEPEGVYKVLEVTNLGDVTIPTAFSFDLYHWGGPSHRISVYHTEGKLTAVEPIETIEPLPRASGSVLDLRVADYRFHEMPKMVPFVDYVAKNSAWITNVNDSRLLQRRDREYHKYAPPPTRPKVLLVKICVLLLLLGVMVSPLCTRSRSQGVFARFKALFEK